VRSLAQPMPDVRGSIPYKREMAVEFAARALITAWERATPERSQRR
jgi:CO/xanthine dehydrogenase FAD-binding subunit